MSKQRLLFITTGGTIASVRTQQGLKPVLSSEELLAHLPELKELCCPETLALCSIDSTDLGQEHWLMMARAIQENYALYDGFIYRGKDVAVLGSGEYALHEVQALLPVVKSVTLLTNGAALTADFPPEVTVCTQKVEAILGEQTVTGVQLADGAVREVSGVFVALGVAGSTALARKLGAAVEGSRIVVDDKMQTTVPGLYAAGDCTGGLLQVAKAVYEGALAGTEAAKALRKG